MEPVSLEGTRFAFDKACVYRSVYRSEIVKKWRRIEVLASRQELSSWGICPFVVKKIVGRVLHAQVFMIQGMRVALIDGAFLLSNQFKVLR